MSRLCNTEWNNPDPDREARAVRNYLLDEIAGGITEHTLPDERIVVADFTCLRDTPETDVPETCSIAFYVNPKNRFIEGDIVTTSKTDTRSIPLPKGCRWTSIHTYKDVKHNHLECSGPNITPCTMEMLITKLRNKNAIL